MSGSTGAEPPGGRGSQGELEPAVPPGRRAMLLAAVTVGIIMLGIQLWLLTVALDLYLAGAGSEVWTLAAFSGVVFLGGLGALRLLERSTPRRP